MTVVSLPLDSLRTDGGTQARERLDPRTVAEYATDMAAGLSFAPVVAFGDFSCPWLADGFHRVRAARRVGFASIAVDLRAGTRRDALLHAAGANATHGLRRTGADKRRAITLLLRDPEWRRWSDREVARHCSVDHKTVGAVRTELSGEIPQTASSERYVSRGGGTYLMRTDGIGHAVLDGDEWYTPQPLIEAARKLLGGIDLDPASCEVAQAVVKAARYFSKGDDGLAQPWHGRVWLNPPYSYPLVEEFTQKLIAEVEAGRVSQAVAIVNNATDTRWFEELATRFPVLFSRGRVRFWRSDREAEAPRYGQALFGVGVGLPDFAAAFHELAYAPAR